MTRIAKDELERLKTDIDLVRLIERQGHQLHKHGKDLAILCPFHDDKTPSLIISPQKNVFNCFGCGERGTVIDWVIKTQGVSFKHAVEILREGGELSAANQKIPKRGHARKIDGPFNQTHENQALLNQVNDYYHQTLKQSPDAIAYLKKRGLDHPELIDTFKLGFCNRSLGYRLLSRDSVAGKAQRQQLNDIGLLRDSGHEHFNGCITIPILDSHQNITELYGRKIGAHLSKGTPLHLYLPGPHKGIFNHTALNTHDEIILCESLIDALTFWCNGYRNVTASYGTNGFTDEMLNAFKQNNIQRVIIAYDRDAAGNAATETLAKKLNAEHIDSYRINFPKGMDANEYALQGRSSVARGQESEATACKMQPANKALSLVIRKAEWLGNGKPKTKITSTDIKSDTPIDEAIEELQSVVSDLSADTLEPENASPQPKAPASDINADISETEIKFLFSNRHYRVRGFNKNLTYDQLKINLLVTRDDCLHSDILDLYSARHRTAFIKQASIELGVETDIIKKDLAKILLKLEALQDEHIKQKQNPESKAAPLSEAQHAAALELLKDKNLLNKILNDFNTCGVIGEETNKLVGYLACVSRKLDKPLAVIIQSSSAAGKSSLMDAILTLMPVDERIQYSAMTGQSLFYMGETNLKHKILAIAEEEGAQQASYALKLLQSEGEITIASTGKDEASGNLVTKEYKVQGPVMLFLTTTAIDIDEELMNRCLVLTVNETREHTQAIHQQQRFDETLDGLLASEHKNQLIELHRNAQRLLKPLKVVNPFAQHLTFLNDKTRTRRDHKKYLMLIRSIALLHQYQREIKTVQHQNKTVEYIEVTLEDISVANNLAHEVLGRTLDELPPQTRILLKLIRKLVDSESKAQRIDPREVRFSRKDIRDHSGWSDGQLKIHCARLSDLEYLLIHQGGRGRALRYELLYDGDINNTSPHLIGLIDPKTLCDSETLGQKAQTSGPSQGQVSPKIGPSQTPKKADNQNTNKHLPLFTSNTTEKAPLNGKTKNRCSVVG